MWTTQKRQRHHRSFFAPPFDQDKHHERHKARRERQGGRRRPTARRTLRHAHVVGPRPIVARRAPAPSSEAPFPVSSLGTDRKANQIATIAMGTLIRKIRRQDPRSI